jgi:hypothetical protein
VPHRIFRGARGRTVRKPSSVEKAVMTAQVHERLILDGEQTSMNCDPPLPHHHPRIIVRPDANMREDDRIMNSTACWRRYVGSWELRDGRLYLLAIDGRYQLTGPEPLPADWFNGILIVPIGETLEYVHVGFESVFAEEVHIRIKNGVEIGRRRYDNRKQTSGHLTGIF